MAFSLAAARREEDDAWTAKERGFARQNVAPVTTAATPSPSSSQAGSSTEPDSGPAAVTPPSPALAYQNPIVAENAPDPQVLYDEPSGTFYMVSTSGRLPAFPIRLSTDLVNWRPTGEYVFTEANRPKWARGSYWAPELHRVGDIYICYFTARSRVTGRLCIGAAGARRPIGPYRDLGRPLISSATTVLDATFFRDDDGRQYLYWKADAADGDPSGPILGQELSPDGLKLVGPRHEVLGTDLEWEHQLVEGPSILKKGGAYYLFYSGSAYNAPSYAIGVARSLSPVEGFVKRAEPILRGSDRWRGPGHNSVVSYDGHDYLIYHAWEGETFQHVRPSLIDLIEWDDEGWPTVGEGIPTEVRSRD